jgi:hypothetical protein
MSQPEISIKPRERDAIINSLRAGVVPRIGQPLIQVGRVSEVKALIKDIDTISDKGSTIRFIIGEYGSGKTFFLQLIRSIALEKKLVTVHADLNPDRRLFGAGGQARALYQELMKNLATRSKPEGGAMEAVVERFVTKAMDDAKEEGVAPGVVIKRQLKELEEMVGGYDFAQVIHAFWEGHAEGKDDLKSAAVRWLRGEFSTKTEAREYLDVRTIVDDASVFDHLKLMSRFVMLAGYSGFLVVLDELVNLYKLTHGPSRTQNYEQLLRIVNDCLQGTASGMGVILGGTPEFLLDTRRGLYSYEALRSRLSENNFVSDGTQDFSQPVIRLANLAPEDIYVLLGKLRNVFASGQQDKYLIDDPGLQAFLDHCNKKLGSAYFRTPRNITKSFLDLLAVLEQSPGKSWKDILTDVAIAPDKDISEPVTESDGELADFTL